MVGSTPPQKWPSHHRKTPPKLLKLSQIPTVSYPTGGISNKTPPTPSYLSQNPTVSNPTCGVFRPHLFRFPPVGRTLLSTTMLLRRSIEGRQGHLGIWSDLSLKRGLKIVGEAMCRPANLSKAVQSLLYLFNSLKLPRDA